MARAPNDKARQAKELFMQGLLLIDIAKKLDVPPGTVRRWKSTYKWEANSERSEKKASVRKGGGQPGNKNAVGDGAPLENKNAEKHGFFSKWLPEETAQIMKSIEKLDPLDILWDNIQLQYVAIIRAQKLMYVKDQQDKTVERISESRGKVDSETWGVQQAWDKHATFLNAQSRAMKTLEGMIKQYDEQLHRNWDLATEEQRERINKLRAEVAKINGGDEETEDLTETDVDIYG